MLTQEVSSTFYLAFHLILRLFITSVKNHPGKLFCCIIWAKSCPVQHFKFVWYKIKSKTMLEVVNMISHVSHFKDHFHSCFKFSGGW